MNRIIQYLSFCDWHISLSIMPSKSVYVIACVRFPSFLWLNNILLYVYATFCIFIHLPMDNWVASSFWLLRIMLLWTWGYKYLFKSLLSLLLGIYPAVELLSHMVIPCFNFFKELPNCFPKIQFWMFNKQWMLLMLTW